MAPKLYMIQPSPPVRAVLMTAKHVGLQLDLKELNLFEAEHLKPEYLNVNPTHTVPTLDDDGFVIWESHAILPYIVEKYGKDKSLYPSDLKERTVVNQRLHFDNGSLFSRLGSVVRPIIREGKKTIDQADIDTINEAYGFLETLLSKTQWVALNTPTVADYSVFATVSSLNVLAPLDTSKYPKLGAWLKKCETLPGATENNKGLGIFTNMIKGKLSA